MRLLILSEAKFRVAAMVEFESIPSLDFLRGVSAQMRGSAAGMWALFDRYAEGGRPNLTAELFHEASRTDQIWEFIKGRLRMYCFIDEGALVVLTHGSIKKTRKADRREITHAVNCRNAFLTAKRRGDLQWETLEHE
jgi:Phage derived protein Gp49-like (DUF891)